MSGYNSTLSQYMSTTCMHRNPGTRKTLIRWYILFGTVSMPNSVGGEVGWNDAVNNLGCCSHMGVYSDAG